MKARLLSLLGLLSISICHAEGTLTFSTAVDYSTGKYGETTRTDTLYIPFGVKYEVSDWTFRSTIPYVESTGPASVSGVGADRIAIDNGATGRRQVSGLGDIVLSASWSAFQEGPWLVELGTKAKLATADESKGLGTGKNDYSVQAELYRSLGSHTLFGTLGFKKMGDPNGVDLKDPLYTSLGWSYRASPSTALGLSYDYRDKLQASGAPLSDATCFLTHKLDQDWKVQTYVSSGFSRASPEFGGGVFVFYTY
ncbi:MAG: hypothetical protein WAV95_01345 [Azonexus sp.]